MLRELETWFESVEGQTEDPLKMNGKWRCRGPDSAYNCTAWPVRVDSKTA